MRKSTPAQWVFRVLIYILGLFFMAIGVAISVNANLGISPVNSLPYAISQISGFALSSCVIGVFTVYILAQIVLREGAGLDEAELRARLARRLADYKVPRYILFLDELPKTTTGKVRPAQLAQEARRRLGL